MKSAAFPRLPLTFLVFMTLKLCGVIAWSWWWVTAPIWGAFIIGAIVASIAISIEVYKQCKGGRL